MRIARIIEPTGRNLFQAHLRGCRIAEVKHEMPAPIRPISHKRDAGQPRGLAAKRPAVDSVGLQATDQTIAKVIRSDGADETRGPTQASYGIRKDSRRSAGIRADKGPGSI